MEKYLKSLYYNIDSESGLSSVNKLHRVAKEDGKFKITRKQVNDFLQGQNTYAFHKPQEKDIPETK